MNWLQVVLLILKLLQQAKSANSADAFATEAGAVGANGEILKWVWEHRQEIIDFISTIINFIPNTPTVGVSGDSVDLRAMIDDLKS